jgi:hypothetical protein
MGKTALLIELGLLAKKHGFVPVRVSTSGSMLDELIEGIQIEGAHLFREKKSPIKSISAGALGFSFGLTFNDVTEQRYGFRAKLTLLCERLAEKDRGVLLLVDEVTGSSSEMRQLATVYQHLVGDGANVAFAMAGLPSAISAVLNDDILTFLNRAKKVHLSELPLADINTYYASVFSDLGISITPTVLSRAAEATRGYPYLFQLLGYNLLLLSAGSKVITQTTLEVALNSSLMTLRSDVFQPILKPLSDVERNFLATMAKDGRVSAIKEALGVSSAYVQAYRSKLIEAGVISSPRRGNLEFDVPYLGEYLR